MIINYETKTADVVSLLEQAGYRKSTVVAHQRCYDDLQMYFTATGRAPTMEVALEWLENRKSVWAYKTYTQYRSALFRLECYVLKGSIACGYCRGIDDFVCQSMLTGKYDILLRDFRTALSANHAKHTVECYAANCKVFLAFLSKQGLASPSEMSIEHILGFWQRVCETQCSSGRKKRYVSAAVSLLTHLVERGDIP